MRKFIKIFVRKYDDKEYSMVVMVNIDNIDCFYAGQDIHTKEAGYCFRFRNFRRNDNIYYFCPLKDIPLDLLEGR